MKKGIKQTKGITLIALVITIIILLILAGISIAMLTGQNGLLTKALKAKEEHLISQYKEEINLIIAEEVAERKTEIKEEPMIVSLEQKIRKKEWVNQEKVKQYNEEGITEEQAENNKYLFVESKEGYEFIIEVDNEKETAKITEANKTPKEEHTITYHPNGGTGETIEKKIKAGFSIQLDECSYHRDGYEFVEWNTNLDGSGTAYKEGDMVKTTEDAVLYAIWEKQREAPEDWKITKDTDVEWYDYGNTKISGPKLTGKMKPIKYVGETQTGNKWANTITMDGSMWVWIPRYAYKITSGYHSATAGTIEVAFLDTQDNFLNGETGAITRNPKEEGAGTTKWLVHPAFTSDASTGGGFGELEGLWIGKFDTTGTHTNLSVKPGTTILRTGTINEQYQSAKKSQFGETVTLNSHMAKNSEWGAIVYLAHSRYGIEGQIIEYNSDEEITGGSTTKKNIYTTNKKKSSTYNATGIYDLCGANITSIASYVNNNSDSLINYGGTNSGDLYGATKEERETSTAYKMVYEGSEKNQVADYEMAKKHKGDAVYETSISGNNNKSSWFSTGSSFPYYSNPFFSRGQMPWGSNGMFGYGHFNGRNENAVHTFRMVLVINN